MADDKTPTMVAYRRMKGANAYYSSDEIAPDEARVKGLEANRSLFTEEEFAEKLAKLRAEFEQGDVVTPTYDALKDMTATYDYHYPMAAETMGARHATVLALLNQDAPALTAEDERLEPKKRWLSPLDKHVTLVKDAYGKPWEAVRRLCEEYKKDEKTGNYYVPSTVIRLIDTKVQEGKDAAKQRRDAAEANKKKKALEVSAS